MDHQDPRASYIVIATRQFAAQGYHGTSLARLAAEAGVTKQALLHFFGTKERLYGAVLTNLADRLMAEIDAAAQPDPTAHLQTYFRRFHQRATEHPDDMRLITRALLDSDATARHWPMKPYLDRLITLTQQTPGGTRPTEEILAWLSQIIAMAQYQAISSPALAGMYGRATTSALQPYLNQSVERAVQSFIDPP